jgi:hypothetical protein
MARVRGAGWVIVLWSVVLVSGCGGLSNEDDDWCSAHQPEVRAEIPRDRLDEYEYRDDTWKDACRRAFADR